jgi:hypothetical protein
MADASTQTTASTDAASQTVVYKQENVSIGFATFDAANQTDVTIGFATFDNASQTGERRNGQFCRSRSPPPARDAPPPAAPAALPALPRVAEMWQVEEQAARRRWLAKNTTVDPVTGAVFEGSSEALFASAGGSGSTVLETPLARGATVGDPVTGAVIEGSSETLFASAGGSGSDHHHTILRQQIEYEL